MTRFWIKLFVSALAIAAASEIGNRSSLLGAILTALPLSTILVAVWLYNDTGSTEQVSRLVSGVAWMLIPSFVFILGLPLALKAGMSFIPALLISCAAMLLCYFPYIALLKRFGIDL